MKCNYCSKEHDPENVKTFYGEDSAAYQRGYCCEDCYTQYIFFGPKKKVSRKAKK